ncbi:MAG: protein-tyrosine phosphatase [Pseudomonadota bacterium]|nr:MAG: protein-tyrosine phosphatase [Pseudomonadota bacterium]
MSSTLRFPTGMVDIHGHLLPGIDDGARTMDMALTMARQAVDDGISLSLLTPHHLNGVYQNCAEDIRREIAAFRQALSGAGIELEVLPGSECHLVPELPRELAAGTAMTVADRGRAVMVELPVHTIPIGATAILEDILSLNLVPVIVHPERNGELARHPERLAEWIDMGCLAQVTSRSCIGKFGDLAQQAARQMVRRGLIHFVASDAHRDHRRIPEMSVGREMIERWTRPEVARLLAEQNPRDLVLGRSIDTSELQESVKSRRFWGLFGG